MNHLLFKQIRLALGLNQKQFSRLLGLSRSYVSMIERGERVVTHDILRKIRKEVDADLIRRVDELLRLRLSIQK